MLTSSKVAITGALASGKSTVCRLLKEMGAYVLSADDIVHDLLSQDTTLKHQIIELLGEDILSNGKLDRQKIASKVFTNNSKLLQLEALLHPLVQAEIEKHYDNIKTQESYPLFVVEIPLLYEAKGMKQFYDVTVVVAADESLCRNRYQDDESYTKRSSRLIPLETKIQQADNVLYNNQGINHLKDEVKKLFTELTERSP